MSESVASAINLMMSSLICSIFILLGFCRWFAPEVAKVFAGVFCRGFLSGVFVAKVFGYPHKVRIGFWQVFAIDLLLKSQRFLAGFWRIYAKNNPKFAGID